MPGPVFIHFQTYARKANEAGNSVAQVIAEALRRPDFCGHVEDPKPPRVVHGTPQTFEADHAAHLEDRATKVQRKGKTHTRAIRQDRHTLATAVASYPLTYDQIAEGGPDAAALHRDWEARTVAWMRDRYGDQLRVVLAHEDEPHPHLHFWLLPDDRDARADTLHPGKVAKHAAEAQAREAGLSDREAVRLGNAALKAAMRDTLDDYWREVGQPVGMTRDGPKRQRLTRAEWQARKAEAARHGETLRRAEVVGAVVEEAEAKAAAVVQDAEAVEAKTKAARADFDRKARAWVEREKATNAARTAENAARAAELDQIAEGLGVRAAAFEAKKAEALATLEKDRREVNTLRKRFNSLLDQAEAFLRRPDLPDLARKVGEALFKKAGRTPPEPEATQAAGGGGLSGFRQRAGIPKTSPVSAPAPQPGPEARSPAPVNRSDDFGL
jgi:arsenate reductase-like glutaredoxin family protein